MNKICIVEDEWLIAKDLQYNLVMNGFNVCSIVDNFDDALYIAKQHKPSFFIMDINLDGDVDGIQIAEHILKIINTNIIFHSSDSVCNHFNRLSKLKYLGFLEKPIDEEKLFLLLNKTR